MTTITLSTNNLQFLQIFECLAKNLDISYKKVEKEVLISKSMQKALEEENNGKVTKLFNHKNAVAEILG